MFKLLVLFYLRLFFFFLAWKEERRTLQIENLKHLDFLWSQRILYLGVYFIICLFNTKKSQKPKIKNCVAEMASMHRDKCGRMEKYTTTPMAEQEPEDPILSSAGVTSQSSVFSSAVTLVESEHFSCLVLSQGWSLLKFHKMCPVTFWLHN